MIEILEFYPIEDNKITNFSGTLKVKLPDQEMIIMGIFVSRSKGRYFFQLPGRLGTHHETGEKVRYPFVCFEDREKQQALIAAIREKGIAYIEARLADTERPLVFPSNPQSAFKPLKQMSQGKHMDSQQKPNVAALKSLIPKPQSKLMTMEFTDPPKRPLTKSNSKFDRK